MKTSIEIKGLKIQAFHGVLQQEHTVGNMYSIDLAITTDFQKAMSSDCLDDTINYAEAAEIVRQEMLIPSQLLENVGGRIIERINSRWGERVQGIDLSIAKLSPPINAEIDSTSIHIII